MSDATIQTERRQFDNDGRVSRTEPTEDEHRLELRTCVGTQALERVPRDRHSEVIQPRMDDDPDRPALRVENESPFRSAVVLEEEIENDVIALTHHRGNRGLVGTVSRSSSGSFLHSEAVAFRLGVARTRCGVRMRWR